MLRPMNIQIKTRVQFSFGPYFLSLVLQIDVMQKCEKITRKHQHRCKVVLRALFHAVQWLVYHVHDASLVSEWKVFFPVETRRGSSQPIKLHLNETCNFQIKLVTAELGREREQANKQKGIKMSGVASVVYDGPIFCSFVFSSFLCAIFFTPNTSYGNWILLTAWLLFCRLFSAFSLHHFSFLSNYICVTAFTSAFFFVWPPNSNPSSDRPEMWCLFSCILILMSAAVRDDAVAISPSLLFFFVLCEHFLLFLSFALLTAAYDRSAFIELRLFILNFALEIPAKKGTFMKFLPTGKIIRNHYFLWPSNDRHWTKHKMHLLEEWLTSFCHQQQTPSLNKFQWMTETQSIQCLDPVSLKLGEKQFIFHWDEQIKLPGLQQLNLMFTSF